MFQFGSFFNNKCGNQQLTSRRRTNATGFGRRANDFKLDQIEAIPVGTEAGPVGTEAGPVMQKPFACSYCGETYNNQKAFNAHKRRHLRKFGYTCSICGRGFNDPNNLEGHLSVHGKSKAFRCPMCSTEFAYRQSFKLHLRNKHAITEKSSLKEIVNSTKHGTKLNTP